MKGFEFRRDPKDPTLKAPSKSQGLRFRGAAGSFQFYSRVWGFEFMDAESSFFALGLKVGGVGLRHPKSPRLGKAYLLLAASAETLEWQ